MIALEIGLARYQWNREADAWEHALNGLPPDGLTRAVEAMLNTKMRGELVREYDPDPDLTRARRVADSLRLTLIVEDEEPEHIEEDWAL